MMTIKFSPEQAKIIQPYVNDWLEQYFKIRYSNSWRWYWMNWEANDEILL